MKMNEHIAEAGYEDDGQGDEADADSVSEEPYPGRDGLFCLNRRQGLPQEQHTPNHVDCAPYTK